MLKFIAIAALLMPAPQADSITYSTWDDNGFCWTNCPQLDAGAYIQSFTQIRGLSGYKAVPEIVHAPTQLRGLRVGLNSTFGNFWTAWGTLVHSSGARYPIYQAASTDGNPMVWYNIKCSTTNICQPALEWGPLQLGSNMLAGSYSLEMKVSYLYGLNPGWTKTVVLAPAVIIASSPAGTAAPTTTTTSIVPPQTTLPPTPRRGQECLYEYGRSGNLVCKNVGGKLKWVRRT